jgi:glutathione S-transferase
MGLPYRLRPVEMLAGVENDPDFLAINPSGFIPAIEDGDSIMVESVAIMEYLLARYGPSPLAPDPRDPIFATYLQFLHMGEAGLAMPIFMTVVSRILAPEAERDNWGARKGVSLFENRLRLVRRQLERTAFVAGDCFTAADISVTYALQLAQRTGCFDLSPFDRDYVARATDRDGYRQAMGRCEATKAWAATVDP